MEDDESTRPCPYCAEEISASAVRCPHCRSRLMEPGRWHRDHPERRLAGVAAGVARALALPVTAVRVAFLVLVFVHFIGPIVYGALWLLMPYAAGEDPPYVAILARAKRFADQLFGGGDGGRRRRPPEPPNGSGPDVGGPVP